MKLGLLLSAILLTGCAEFTSVKNAIGTYTQTAADESVQVGRWKHCNAESVGAIKRIYNTPEKMNSYNEFCRDVELPEL